MKTTSGCLSEGTVKEAPQELSCLWRSGADPELPWGPRTHAGQGSRPLGTPPRPRTPPPQLASTWGPCQGALGTAHFGGRDAHSTSWENGDRTFLKTNNTNRHLLFFLITKITHTVKKNLKYIKIIAGKLNCSHSHKLQL